MSETPYTPERRFSGASRLFIGFAIGAVFALAPMYYFYMGRDAALRAANSSQDQTLASEPPGIPGSRESAGGATAFASRLTYELSRLPEEPLPTLARAPAASANMRSAPAAPAEDESASARIANARPISAAPPDPRDRTVAIESERRKDDYEIRGARAPQPEARPRRVYEGRDVDLTAPSLPDMPTRPITSSSTNTRAEIEAERQRAAAAPSGPGGVKVDARPIVRADPATGKNSSQVVAKAPVSAEPPRVRSDAAGASPPAAAARSVESHLASTREWLASAPATTHTIQLMGTGSSQHLEDQLKSMAKILDVDRIHLFRTKAQGKPSITVLYGEFADRRSALQALAQLPAAVAANRPVLRTVNGIRAEMKQHDTDGAQ